MEASILRDQGITSGIQWSRTAPRTRRGQFATPHHPVRVPRFSDDSVAMVRFVLIVTGSIQARPESINKVVVLSLAHVRRSRREPGCLLHSVQHDVEDPLRLVFLEHWVDEDALRAHFRVPESGAFVRDVAALAASAPEMTIYAAQAVSI